MLFETAQNETHWLRESASQPAAAMAVQISAGIIHRPVSRNIILRKLSFSDHTLPNKSNRFPKTQHHFRCRPGWTSRETFLRSWTRPTWGSTSGCMQSAPCRGPRSVLFLRLSTLSIKESRSPGFTLCRSKKFNSAWSLEQ